VAVTVDAHSREAGLDWEARWARLWHAFFYATLGLPSALAATDPSVPAGRRALTLAIAAALGAWYAVVVIAHPDWAERLQPMAVHLAVMTVVFIVLVGRDERFFLLIYSLYPQVFMLLPGRWAYAGAAVIGLLAAWVSGQLSRALDDPTAALGTLGNVGLAMAVGLFINSIARQSEQRRLMIEALERARAELAETAAENARLLATAHQAGVLDERRRLAREVHDTLAQGLTGIVMQLEAAEALLDERRSAELGARLGDARRMARESLGEARRAVHALRPAALEGARLPDALAELADRFAAETGVKAAATATGQVRPVDAKVEVALLRVAQEALANVRKHAGATRAGLTLSYLDELVLLDVRDDGKGFDPARRPGQGGFGLTAMAERLAEVGGRLEVETGPGEGTTIVASVPLPRGLRP
jgi:signal transduction histidine kinase